MNGMQALDCQALVPLQIILRHAACEPEVNEGFGPSTDASDPDAKHCKSPAVLTLRACEQACFTHMAAWAP